VLPNKNSGINRGDYLIAIAIFAAGLLFNLIRLNYWSPLPDEINYARCARFLVENRTFFSTDIMFFPPLFVYLSAILQKAGLELLISVRLISAFAGALIVPLLFFSARTCLPRSTAVLGTLCILPMFSLHCYSRLGQVEILMLFFIVLALLFLLRALTTTRQIFALYAGVALGLGLWTKETTLGAVAASTLFLLLSPAKSLRLLLNLLLGLALPATGLAVLSHFSGQNLLFEITRARGYDINMLQLHPIASFLALAGNLSYNLLPRIYYPWEFITFIILSPVLTVLLLVLVVRDALQKNLISRFVIAYLTIHLPFFFLFSRKFDYYLLPSALFIVFAGGLAVFTPGGPRNLRKTGIVLLLLLGFFNIYADRFLYFNRGTHGSFATAVQAIPPQTVIATSHPSLVEYLSHKAGLNLKVMPLFQKNSYQINPEVWADSSVAIILVKYYYYERLKNRLPDDWTRLTEIFPEKREIIDRDWSIFLTVQERRSLFPRTERMAELTRPTGILILFKAPPSAETHLTAASRFYF
jgi:4-amino-4-deoxy-L-arabinose transferase-like glycosyltransferase